MSAHTVYECVCERQSVCEGGLVSKRLWCAKETVVCVSVCACEKAIVWIKQCACKTEIVCVFFLVCLCVYQCVVLCVAFTNTFDCIFWQSSTLFS